MEVAEKKVNNKPANKNMYDTMLWGFKKKKKKTNIIQWAESNRAYYFRKGPEGGLLREKSISVET